MDELESSRLAEPEVSENGNERIAWTRANMPLLADIRSDFQEEKPFKGSRIGMCLHVEPKTAVLIEVLRSAGAEVVVTGSPGTTDDAVAAALSEDPGIHVYSKRSDTSTTHIRNLESVLNSKPDLLIDNGADLVAMTLERGEIGGIVGGTEETTSGRSRHDGELESRVPFPMIVINDSPLKLLVENQHGVGPTVVEGFMRTTNRLVPTNRFVVVGYGSCGKGIARSLRAMAATVVVVEIDPIRALEAAFDGMIVSDLESALPEADTVITVTGRRGVIARKHLEMLKDGAMLANAGHFGFEIDKVALRELAKKPRQRAAGIDEYELTNGRRVMLLGDGEMLNLTGATGNQIEVMDLGFALQLRSLQVISSGSERLVPGAQSVPNSVNHRIAVDMLSALSTVQLAHPASQQFGNEEKG